MRRAKKDGDGKARGWWWSTQRRPDENRLKTLCYCPQKRLGFAWALGVMSWRCRQAGPIAPGGRGLLGGCAKDGPGLQGTRALGSHSLASVANGCAWGETKDTRNMHDAKRCDAMQAVSE